MRKISLSSRNFVVERGYGNCGRGDVLRRNHSGCLRPLCALLAGMIFGGVQTRAAEAKPGIPWVAVHDFTVPDAWREKGRSGWQVASGLENELVQSGRFNVVTRAKIAQVLRERRITSSSSMEPSDFGQIVGADYIVTGQIDDVGGRTTVIGKLIKVKGEDSGKIEKSFDVSGLIPNDKIFAERFPTMLKEIAEMLTKTPGELLNDGLAAMKRNDFVSALRLTREMNRQLPEPETIRRLTAAAAARYGRTPVAKLLAPEERQMSDGRLLDHALELMARGAHDDAGKVFHALESGRLELGIDALLKRVAELAEKKQAHIDKVISSARLKYRDAILGQESKQRGVAPEKLCDEAVRELRAFLHDPAMHLPPNVASDIQALIADIEDFRSRLFQGPTDGAMWKIPDIEMELLPVPAGSYEYMVDLHEDDHETRQRQVTISRPFWIGRTEVTIGQFIHFLRGPDLSADERRAAFLEIDLRSPDSPLTPNGMMKPGRGATWGSLEQPMVMVSWRGARLFCEWLTRREQKAGRLPADYVYRLPTEAEWEYACLAGRASFVQGNPDEYAWFRENSDGRTREAGSKQANPWGIHDMHGNVWEWCHDWYRERRNTLDVRDPLGPVSSADNCKVLKGGSFASREPDLLPSARFHFGYQISRRNIGFRVVCAPAI